MLAEEWVLVLGEPATVGVMPERPMIKAKVKTASWVFMDISQKFGLTMMARRSRWILTSGRDSLWHDHIQHECSKPLCWLNPAMGFRLQFLPADRSGLVGDWLVELTSERVLVVRVSHSTLYCDPLFQPGRGADMDDSPPLSLWLKPLLSA